jgi:S1-C subfamily serine protease
VVGSDLAGGEGERMAVAIGNPFALEGAMTVGFVSALGRLLPVESDGRCHNSFAMKLQSYALTFRVIL